jgi:O-acetylhomoserine/O-acetylserine sulfhydrylase
MITSPSAAYGNAPLAEIFFPVGFALQVRIEVNAGAFISLIL